MRKKPTFRCFNDLLGLKLTLVFTILLCSVAQAQLPSTLYAGHQKLSGSGDQIDLVDTTGLAFNITSTITVTSSFGPVNGVYGISQNPISNDVYVLYESTGGANARRLGILNTLTNVISDIGNAGNLTDIAFTPDGTLYGVQGNQTAAGEIFVVNTATAATTAFISPASGNWGQTLGYDASADELYFTAQNGGFDKIDYNTVNQTTQTTSGFTGETQAMAVLNGTTAWVQSYTNLYSLNTQTGAYTLVSSGTNRYHAFGFVGASCSDNTSSFSETACGSYTVPSGDETYTMSGTYMDTIPNVGGCDSVMTISVTINPLDDASYNYSSSSYCVDDTDPTPTITGLSGGGFTSTPAGLSLNGSTGAIDVSASTPGTYTITYTTTGTCPNTNNVAVTINALDNASFNYSSSFYCVNDADPMPTVTGLGGGGFTSVPAGLSINTSTGAIDVSASTPGTYTVTYTTAGTCPNSANASITINGLDDANFVYSAVSYCTVGTDPTPTITGLGGGMFTSTPTGLSINGSTGEIDLDASTPGSYTVTYTTAGTCPNSSNVSVAVTGVINTTETLVACDSLVWQDGNTYYASTNTPSVTLTSTDGCDSIVTLNLTVNYSSIGIDTQIACDSYTWIDGNTYTASNNTATHVLTNAAGCDSTVTLNLTVNYSSTGTDTQIACDSYTWIDGNTYTASNNTATHILTNAAGCDSTVTLDLTVNYSSTGTDTQIACDSLVWIDGNTYYASNNTATHVLTNAAGCDSSVTLDLTVNYSSTGTDTQVACDSYTWIDGNTYTASNNTATHVLTNAAGCDSTVTLDLIVNYSSIGTDVIATCDSLVWIDGNTYYTSNNTATHVLTNAAGCDSTVTLELTIGNNTGVDVLEACDSLTWIDGITYTSSNNTATFTLTNVLGCDSVVTLDLTITTLDLTVTNNSPTLVANSTTADSLQWIDCDNGNMPIAGETNASFTATVNGNYAVIVYENGCADTSACVNVANVGVNEQPQFDFNLYPNPNDGEFVLDVEANDIISIEIIDIVGKQISFYSSQINSNQVRVSLKEASTSVVFVRIRTSYGETTKRVVIQ